MNVRASSSTVLPLLAAILVTMINHLDGYQPRTDLERFDVARVRALLGAGDAWSRDNAVHLTGSAVVVDPAKRKVLLRWHRRLRGWLQVGGHGDPGETDPLAVALREAREETGLTDLRPWPSADLIHVVVVSVPASAHEPAHEHADLRYALATDRPTAARPERPDAPLRWLGLTEAIALTAEDNLSETLRRVSALFGD